MFGRISEGQRLSEVRAMLGAPVEENWMYGSGAASLMNESAGAVRDCRAIHFERDRVIEMFETSACEGRGIRVDQSKADVERLLGLPTDQCWGFTRPRRRGGTFPLRLVCFHADRVEMVARRWIF